MKKPYCNIGEVNKWIKSVNPSVNPKYKSQDDVSSGHMFADMYKDYARYNTTSKDWFVYNGVFWEEDIGGMIVERYAKFLYKALYLDAIDGSKEYRKYVTNMGNRSTRQKMIEDAREHYHVCQTDFDSNGNLLNVQNGVIDLSTFELLEHSPGLLLSKVANVSYYPGKKSDLFERFISEVTCGDFDKMKYIQKILGYGLTSDNSEEEAYILYGATTRNGKSTLLETIAYILGDYALNMSPETLAQRKKDSRTASGDIARLNECRFLHMSEPPKRMVFDVALLKTLLGRDKITARELYQREFEFVPKFKLFINTNFLPIVNDDTLFSSGRIKVITFDRHFTEEEQDKSLKDTLKTDDNMSGILNWCLEGLKMYRKEGLIPPNAIKDATNDYREKSDKIKLFIEDCLVEDSGHNETMNSLYEEYQSWCKSNGYGTENKSNFKEELKNKSLLSETGTVNGKTFHNVVKGYRVEKTYYDSDDSDRFEIPFK